MERLICLRAERKMSQQDVANCLGISRQAYGHYETNLREPDNDTIVKLAEIFGVTTDYLLGRSDAAEGNVELLKEPLTVGAMIPVLGKVPAGVPIEAIENVIDEIDISEKMAKDGHKYFGLLVTGDSMYPEYMDGDIVVVRQQETAETGDDVIAYVNGYDATVKRLIRSSASLTLRALNPTYETKTYTSKECEELPVQIVGVVVEMRRRRR